MNLVNDLAAMQRASPTSAASAVRLSGGTLHLGRAASASPTPAAISDHGDVTSPCPEHLGLGADQPVTIATARGAHAHLHVERQRAQQLLRGGHPARRDPRRHERLLGLQLPRQPEPHAGERRPLRDRDAHQPVRQRRGRHLRAFTGITSEQCDQGGLNGTAGSCCTSTCTFRGAAPLPRLPPASATGRDLHRRERDVSGRRQELGGVPRLGGVCDRRELHGVSDACPADATSHGACRGSAGVCDVAETCTGVEPRPVRPTPSAQHDAVCRGSAGVCDLAENCTGSGAACPADAQEHGASAAAPPASATSPRLRRRRTTTVRPTPSSRQHRVPRRGRRLRRRRELHGLRRRLSGRCQEHGRVPRPRPASATSPRRCDGVERRTVPPTPSITSTARHVPRRSAGVCDVAETCTASGAACPADAKSTAECRASAGVCDVAETCDGVGDDCPADAFEPPAPCAAPPPASATSPRPATARAPPVRPTRRAGDRHVPRRGRRLRRRRDLRRARRQPARPTPKSTAECRARGRRLRRRRDLRRRRATTVRPTPSSPRPRRAAPPAGVCDVAETCDGADATVRPTPSSPQHDVPRRRPAICDVAETCTARARPVRPMPRARPVCRPAAGVCDVAETCDGVERRLPGRQREPARSTTCRAVGRRL